MSSNTCSWVCGTHLCVHHTPGTRRLVKLMAMAESLQETCVPGAKSHTVRLHRTCSTKDCSHAFTIAMATSWEYHLPGSTQMHQHPGYEHHLTPHTRQDKCGAGILGATQREGYLQFDCCWDFFVLAEIHTCSSKLG